MKCLVSLQLEKGPLLPALLQVILEKNQRIKVLAELLFFSFLVLEIMNPVYSPGSSGVPYANAKGIGYPGKQIKLCFIIEVRTLGKFPCCSECFQLTNLAQSDLYREENVLGHGTEKSRARTGFGQSLIWWLQQLD